MLPYIHDRKLFPCLKRINCLVLSAVILKHDTNILHQGNCGNVSNEEGNPYQAVNKIEQERIFFCQKSCKVKGDDYEHCNSKEQGKKNSDEKIFFAEFILFIRSS